MKMPRAVSSRHGAKFEDNSMDSTTQRPKMATAYRAADQLASDINATANHLEVLLREVAEPRSESLLLGLTFGALRARSTVREARKLLVETTGAQT